jgi:CDP-paratose 2-epimerase
MKILITGGLGFIGTNICLEARKRGYDVIAFDSMIRAGVEQNVPILEKAGVTIFHGDIRVQQDWVRFIDEHKDIQGIIHLAGNPGIPWSIAHPVYDFEVNALGTLLALSTAKLYGCPLIYASTNKTYSDILNEIPLQKEQFRYKWVEPKEGWIKGVSSKGVSEDFPTDGYGKYAHSPYGISKLTGDMYCQEYFHTYNLPVVINRMSCIYGYYQQGVADQGWIDHFVRQAFTENPTLDIYGDGKHVRDMLWGEDVARLYLDELEHIDEVKGEIFNVGGGIENTLSLLESIEYIQRISKKKFTLTMHDWRLADQKVYISDTTKVKEKLGWRPTVSPQRGISLMYDRYKEVNK